MRSENLNLLFDEGMLSPLDLHFGRFMASLADREGDIVALAAALVSNQSGDGNICLELSDLAGKRLADGKDEKKTVNCPDLEIWRKTLMESGVVGKPGEFKPLILDGRSRLYLHRYWTYENKLINLINSRVQEDAAVSEMRILREGIERLFPVGDKSKVDWQRVAAVAALRRRFCVITGGPGTGKTTTVVKILALLLEQVETDPYRIVLAAPTGKGAMRLLETVRQGKERLDCSPSIKGRLPEEATTVHRLLGPIPASPYFHYNEKNPLPVDLVILDEASMVDLALMSKLMQALPSTARLILLGDKDQLASVEAGAVLGDICDRGKAHGFSPRFCHDVHRATGSEMISQTAGDSEPDLGDCIIELKQSYRFGAESGLQALCTAVNEGNEDLALALLKDETRADIAMDAMASPVDLFRAIRKQALQRIKSYLRREDPREILKEFNRFKILCALREGPYGVVAVNRWIEQTLRERGLVERKERWYRGRPIMITSNDYDLNLFNGDVGIVLPDPHAGGGLRVFFPGNAGSLRRFHPVRLPEHETVYAMTVHKSQGSEFDEVFLILSDRESPVLTRELLYTGISRAKDRIHLWAPEAVFRKALSRRVERTSGLRDGLWGVAGLENKE